MVDELPRKRRMLVRARFANRVDLHGRRFVVTGASPGSLGFETARILGTWGASVVVTARTHTEETVRALEQATARVGANANFQGHPLDLSSADSVARFVRWLCDDQGDPDVLVNNAGIHLDLLSQWKEPRLSADGFEVQWRTNYLGTMHLTHLLLPALRRTASSRGDARIVNVVSKLHFKGSNRQFFDASVPYNSWTAYAGSKLALVHATLEAERRFAGDGVRSYCLHPGGVSTNVADKGLAGTGAQRVRRALLPLESWFLRTPEEGAQTQIHCATAANLAGGTYYEDCRPTEPSPDARDEAVAKRLWDETEAWVRAQGSKRDDW